MFPMESRPICNRVYEIFACPSDYLYLSFLLGCKMREFMSWIQEVGYNGKGKITEIDDKLIQGLERAQ